MSLYHDLTAVLTPYANKIKQNETNIQLALSLEGGGAPTVVSNISDMTDTAQIYVLSTDGMWYYYDSSAWVAGGTYGAVVTDTTLTQTGIPADAKAVGKALASKSEIDLYVENPNNILDWSAEGVLTGKVWYNNNNADTINGSASISDFMSVESGDTICLNLVARLKWFNENKTFLSTVTGGTYKLVTAPEGAAYFRVQVSTDNLETAWLYKYYGTYYDFSAFSDHVTTLEIADKNVVIALSKGVNTGLKEKSIDMSNVQDNTLSYEAIDQLTLWRWSIVDNTKNLVGWRINDSTGIPSFSGDSGSTLYVTSDFCRVQPGEQYRGYNGTLYGYDANKTYVGVIALTATYLYTIPDGIYYVRTCQLKQKNEADVYIFTLAKDGYGKTFSSNGFTFPYEKCFPIFPDDDEKTGFKLHLDIEPWYNKKILVIGDSFTAPGYWQEKMCSNFYAISISSAISGAGWTTNRTKTVYQLAQEVSIDPDIIIIAIGTNDLDVAAGEFINGTSVDDYSTDTVWGGIQKALTYIRNRWTGVPVYVGFTPAGGLAGNAWAKTNAQVEILKEACLRYGCVYIETRTCGMAYPMVQNDLIFRRGDGDGHPSYEGQMQIARYMTDLMSGYMHSRSWDLPTIGDSNGETEP